MAAKQTSDQQPQGEPCYLGLGSRSILCPHSSAIPKNSVNLLYVCMAPKLPFSQLNEAWICSPKGFASVFYGPCCGIVLTQKSKYNEAGDSYIWDFGFCRQLQIICHLVASI